LASGEHLEIENQRLIADTLKKALTHQPGTNPIGGVTMLSGSWGCGKTHLWNHVVKPDLQRKHPTQLIVEVSCFGVESIQALKTLFVTKFLFEKGKSADRAENLAVLAKSGAQLIAGSLIAAAQKKLGFDFLNFQPDPIQLLEEGLVVCCDDLERKASTLPIESVMGFLRTLAEQKNARVLIIANEDQVATSEKETYLRTKEKTIDRALRMAANQEQIFQYFTSAPPLTSEESAFLREKKQFILRPFQNSKNENLRTLRRVLEDNLLMRDPKLEVPDSYIEVLSSLSLEHASGTMELAEFYDFNEYVVEFRKGRREPSELDKRRIEYLKKYFSVDLTFKYSKALYDFVKDGFLDRNQLKSETQPDEKELGEVDLFIQNLRGENFFFCTEADMEKAISEIQRMLSSGEALEARQIIELVIHLNIGLDFLGRSMTANLKSAITQKLQTLAAKGDRSFEGIEQMRYRSYHNHWKEFKKGYDDSLGKYLAQDIIESVKAAITSGDNGQLYNVIFQKPETLAPMILFGLDLDFYKQFENKPKWLYYVFELTITELTKYGTGVIENSEAVREHLKTFLESCANLPNTDKMQKYRLETLLEKLG
jgi:hypothetical protein